MRVLNKILQVYSTQDPQYIIALKILDSGQSTFSPGVVKALCPEIEAEVVYPTLLWLASEYVNLLEMRIYTERDGERVDLDLSELRTHLEGGRVYYPGTEKEIPRNELYLDFQIVED